jgi:hypothetical protein
VNLLKNDIGVEQAGALVTILKEHLTLKSLCGNKGDETELDMSGKMKGAEDAIMLAAEIVGNGALSIANVMGNCIGKEMLSTLQEIMRSKPNLISLCGIADDATEANLSGLNMDADDTIILASELPNKGALSSLNLASNSLGAEALMGSTELYVGEKLVTAPVAGWAPPALHRSLPSDRLEVVSASPPLADGEITNVTEVLGKVAMVSRGGCSFVMKAQHLQAAGATAMVCVNNVEDKPDEVFAMFGGGAENITIPVMMVGFNTGVQIRALAEMAITTRKSLSLSDALENHK